MSLKTRISKDKLIAFINEASEKCSYSTASGIKETRLTDGTRIIGPYTKGELSYTDTYKGFEWFKGKEEITVNDKVIWRREYEGGITDKAHEGKAEARALYEFLKAALRECPKDKPFRRGPESNFKQEDYEYVDICEGNIDSFKGKEIIRYKGRAIYELEYNGGYD